MNNIFQNQALAEQIKERLRNVNRTQAYLAKVFGKRPQQITQALGGTQPALLKKILSHIEILEEQKSKVIA